MINMVFTAANARDFEFWLAGEGIIVKEQR
jgi:hypothetical protein